MRRGDVSVLTIVERITAGLALLIFAPLVMVAALAIALESGFPVFFGQERVGKDGKAFRLFKLRSMRNDKRGTLITAAGDARVTRVGTILRRYKLDELPQLWNIVAGHMQFVGPRPEVPAMVNGADPLWHAVLAGKPGLTDLATLVYRHEEDILAHAADPDAAYRREVLPQKLALSIAYGRKRNLGTDLKLLWLSARYSFFPAGFQADTIKHTFLEAE
jgi:lipopolysaccharide/colanic/teichoic acid biosynthesis glycosyltransferase